jgi:hypothetical protein
MIRVVLFIYSRPTTVVVGWDASSDDDPGGPGRRPSWGLGLLLLWLLLVLLPQASSSSPGVLGKARKIENCGGVYGVISSSSSVTIFSY